MVMNLNMIDVAEGMGISIDEKGLSDVLGVPVVSTAMKTGRGKEALLSAIESAAAEQKKPSAASLNLYPKLEAWIKEIRSMLESKPGLNDKVALGWLAVKLLENDAEALNILKKNVPDYKEITDKVTSFFIDMTFLKKTIRLRMVNLNYSFYSMRTTVSLQSNSLAYWTPSGLIE